MTKDDESTKANDTKLEQLRIIYEDARSEIRQRIEQRDKYIIQQLITLGTILGVAFYKKIYELFILIPFISLYYTLLIEYSYRIHNKISKNLRNIEPEMTTLSGLNTEFHMETYHHKEGNKERDKKTKKEEKINDEAGIRHLFFMLSFYITLLFSLSLIFYYESNEGINFFIIATTIISVIIHYKVVLHGKLLGIIENNLLDLLKVIAFVIVFLITDSICTNKSINITQSPCQDNCKIL